MKSLKILVLAIFLLLPAVNMLAQDGGIKIIVNESNAMNSISADQVSRLFLKKTTKWNNGEKVIPVNLYQSHELREIFCEKFHGQSMAAIRSYWQKQIFSGKGVPPVEQEDEKAIIAYVKAHPGTIAYVSESTATDGVKVLTVIY